MATILEYLPKSNHIPDGVLFRHQTGNTPMSLPQIRSKIPRLMKCCNPEVTPKFPDLYMMASFHAFFANEIFNNMAPVAGWSRTKLRNYLKHLKHYDMLALL